MDPWREAFTNCSEISQQKSQNPKQKDSGGWRHQAQGGMITRDRTHCTLGEGKRRLDMEAGGEEQLETLGNHTPEETNTPQNTPQRYRWRRTGMLRSGMNGGGLRTFFHITEVLHENHSMNSLRLGG